MGRKVWVPAVSGPLAGYAAGYGSWLRAQYYSRSAISDRLWQFDQLSRWLDREGIAVGDVNAAECERFATSQRAAGRITLVAPQSMTLPEEYLRALGVTPQPVPPLVHGPVEELLGDFGSYLLIERGLSPHTVFDAYVPAARLFLAGRDGPSGLRLDRLAAADVSMFLARECPKRSVSGTRDLICSAVLSRGHGEAAPGWLRGRRFWWPDQVDELACVSVLDGAVRLIFAGWLPQDGLFGWNASAGLKVERGAGGCESLGCS